MNQLEDRTTPTAITISPGDDAVEGNNITVFPVFGSFEVHRDNTGGPQSFVVSFGGTATAGTDYTGNSMMYSFDSGSDITFIWLTPDNLRNAGILSQMTTLRANLQSLQAIFSSLSDQVVCWLDKRRLSVGDFSGRIWSFDLDKNGEYQVVGNCLGPVTCLSPMVAGQSIIAGCANGTASVWKLPK